MRSVWFGQRHRGAVVAGAELGFGFRADTLLVIRSSAVPGLVGDGRYAPGAAARAERTVPIAGYTGVRLQLRRWLGVQPGVDRARIRIDGVERWVNSDAALHQDVDWRFQDFELDDGDAVSIELTLDADQATEYGGWTVDDVCVVATGGAPPVDGGADPDASSAGPDAADVAEDGPGGGGYGVVLLAALVLTLRRRRRPREVGSPKAATSASSIL